MSLRTSYSSVLRDKFYFAKFGGQGRIRTSVGLRPPDFKCPQVSLRLGLSHRHGFKLQAVGALSLCTFPENTTILEEFNGRFSGLGSGLP